MSSEEEQAEKIPCSFCGKQPEDVESLIAAGGQLAICNECVQLCLSILEEKKIDETRFAYIPGERYRKPKEKLRPISKLPEGWQIRTTELYATEPFITACSPTGKQHADFALPKQLAWWMISNDKALDVDELREEVTKHISYVVMQTLLKY